MQILNTYSKLIELIENQSFRTANLGQLQLRFKQGNHSACLAVHKLSKRLTDLISATISWFAFVLNGLMFWELRQMMRIEAWKEAHASQLPTGSIRWARWMRIVHWPLLPTIIPIMCTLAWLSIRFA